MDSALLPVEVLDVETESEPSPGFKDEGSPTDEHASSALVVADESVPADELTERPDTLTPVLPNVPLQPPRSVALYIDGDNQSPAIARDLLASVRQDLGLDVSRVMREVIDHYRRDPQAPPAYVLFVSDGGVHQNREITNLMREAAQYPIFWQFMGLGGRNYGILEKLDTMSGRVVDNCGFFAIDDLRDLTEAQLYDRLLQEFPDWLTAARGKGIIR